MSEGHNADLNHGIAFAKLVIYVTGSGKTGHLAQKIKM